MSWVRFTKEYKARARADGRTVVVVGMDGPGGRDEFAICAAHENASLVFGLSLAISLGRVAPADLATLRAIKDDVFAPDPDAARPAEGGAS